MIKPSRKIPQIKIRREKKSVAYTITVVFETASNVIQISGRFFFSPNEGSSDVLHIINTEILGTTLSFPGTRVPKLGSEHCTGDD